MESGKSVSAILLTRGDPALLKNCLHSLTKLQDFEDLEVIVVEHETAEAEAMMKEEFPGSLYFQQKDSEETNQSFSSMNNFGVSKASGKFIWLVNNDVAVRKNTLAELRRCLDEKPDVGIVGTKLLFADDTIQHIGVIFDGFGVPRHLGHERPDTAEYEPSTRSEYYDAVTFASVLIRREVWEAVGGLDEAYHFNFEDVDFCVKARKLGVRCFVPMSAVAYHFQSQSREFRTSFQHSVTRNLKVFRDKWIFSGELERILQIPIQREFGPLQDSRPNIAFAPAAQDAGISYWRMDQVMRMLAEKKLANIEQVFATTAEAKVMEVMDRADLVIWQSHHNDGIKRLAGMGTDRSFAMIYEYDDHPIYISPFAAAYKVFGCKEEKIRSADGTEIWLWRDGQNGFNLETNRKNRQTQLEIISLVDAVTTTTEPLGSYFKTLNSNVFVLPNCVNFDVYRTATDLFERKPGPVRIGWWGGDNHWHDVSIIGRPLVEYVNSHDVQLVLLGAYYKGPLKGIDPNKVIDYQWTHVEAFPWRLQAAAIDVAVIPLASPVMKGMKFNHFKSDIKWLEASALKLPCLVQGGMAAYQSCSDGENSLTFVTDDEFKEKLDILCRDKEYRTGLAQSAYDWAYEHRNLSKEIHRWSEAYWKVIQRREIPTQKVAQEA